MDLIHIIGKIGNDHNFKGCIENIPPSDHIVWRVNNIKEANLNENKTDEKLEIEDIF